MRRVLNFLKNRLRNVIPQYVDGSMTHELWVRPASHNILGMSLPRDNLLHADLGPLRLDRWCSNLTALAGIVLTLLLKDSSHSLIDDMLPEPLRLGVLVREECDLESCIDAVTCWVIDRALVAMISSRLMVRGIRDG